MIKFFKLGLLISLNLILSLLVFPTLHPVFAAAILRSNLNILLSGNPSVPGAVWADATEAEEGDTIAFKVNVYNDGDETAQGVKVKVDLSSNTNGGSNLEATSHITADNASEVLDATTVTLPTSGNFGYFHTPGRAMVITSAGRQRLTAAADTVTSTGIDIGTIPPGVYYRVDILLTARIITSQPTSTPTPTNTVSSPITATPAPVAQGYALAESLTAINDITTPQQSPVTFPVTIPYTFTDTQPGIKTLFIKFFYSDGSTRVNQKSLVYTPGTLALDSVSSVSNLDQEPIWTHTVSGARRVLVVTMGSWGDPPANLSGATVIWTADGMPAQNLTLLRANPATPTTPTQVAMWYLVAPNTGSGTIAVSGSGSSGNRKLNAVSSSWTSASQDPNPFSSSAADQGNNVGLASATVSSAPNEIVIDALSDLNENGKTDTPDPGQTLLLDVGGGNNHIVSSYKTGSASTTMQWTKLAKGNNTWAIVAGSLRPN